MQTVRLLGICGSPRKTGNSHYLLERALESGKLVAPDQVEIELCSISGKQIGPCIACDRCEKVGDCTTEDDFQELRDKWVAADAIVYSVPVYHMGMPGQLKCFIDRLGNSLYSRYGAGIIKSLKPIGVAVQGCHLFAGQEQVIAGLVNHAMVMGCVPIAGDPWESYTGAAGWTRNLMSKDALRELYDRGEEDARIAVAAAESLGKRVAEMALVIKYGAQACQQLLCRDDSYQDLLSRVAKEN